MILASSVIVVVAATVFFTLFVRVQDIPAPEPVSPTRHLEERKAAIYENLRDLQFEFRVGKLSDADYQQTKVGLQKELAGVIGEIERLSSGVPGAPAPKGKPAVKPAKAAEVLTCPHCGAKLPKPMKFCGECGKAMA
jgi:zinc-ribbon domain